MGWQRVTGPRRFPRVLQCTWHRRGDPESEAKGILGLCPTRWTVRASCFQRILDNYAALLQEWTISLDNKLQSDIRGRIWIPSANEHFWLLFRVEFRTAAVCAVTLISFTKLFSVTVLFCRVNKYFEWIIKQLLNSAFVWYEDIQISESVIHRAQAFGFGG